MGMLKLTKLEATMYNALTEMNVPYRLFGQYTINMPGNKQPFVLDFAYPELGVGIETDGSIWHDREDLKTRDQERDQKLSDVGWRIMRFSENAVYEHLDTVRDIIAKNVQEAAKAVKKAAATSGGLVKLSSIQDAALDLEQVKGLHYEIEDFPDIGYIIKIGL